MKKITYAKSFFFLATFLAVVSFGFGQIITFDFNGNLGNETSVTSNYNVPNLTSSSISRGAGLNAFNNVNRFNSRSWASTSIANAITGNDYVQFTITPISGYQFNMSTIIFNIQRSDVGLRGIALRSSIDGYTNNIDGEKNIADNTNITEVVTFTVNQSNITTSVIYRVYGWAEFGTGAGGFEGVGNDIIVNGSVYAIPVCSEPTVTWTSSGWSPVGGPTIDTPVIINESYNTAINGGSFSACSLTVNSGATLNITDGYFIKVENDVTVDRGIISVSTKGAFVQNSDLGTFSLINLGSATVNKTTRNYFDSELHYVYWSSPVKNANVISVFGDPYLNRRFYFNASLYLDEHTNGTTNGISDDIDDNGNDWQVASGIMDVGRGYVISTTFPFLGTPYSNDHQFSGAFNTGNIDVPIYRNDSSTSDTNWNLIGNPYPSAINVEDFLLQNYYDVSNPAGTLGGVIYLWTHNSVASVANSGNQTYNFSQDDYATMNLAGGVLGAPLAADSGGEIPNGYIPSGQGFFVTYSNNGTTTSSSGNITEGNVNFNNAMRMADGTSNSQFFKSGNSKKNSHSNANKLWLNLTSNNGVFNQSLIAYLTSASNNYDGEAFDAPKNLSSDVSTILYTTIEDSDKKFAIQARSSESLNKDEIISLGFSTKINVATLYTLSIAQIQGDFLTNNPVYIKDQLLNTTHNLTVSDYTFTSDVGEFNTRFQIVFSANALSTENAVFNSKVLKIIDLGSNRVQFNVSDNLSIKTVTIFDVLGRPLYNLKGHSNSETYSLSKLNDAIYVAKVELSNGAIITKKAVKR